MLKLLAVIGLVLLLAAPASATNNNAFQPTGATISVSASSSSSSAGFTVGTSTVASQMILQNAGSATAFCRWGVGAQTALVTDFPVAAGAILIVTKGPSDTLACLTSTGSTTIYATAGEGY